MSSPTKPKIDYSYTGFEQENQEGPFPGTQLDNDLANLVASASQTIDALADIRRADGALNNGIVTADSLAEDLLIGLKTPTIWETTFRYVVLDCVTSQEPGLQGVYRCIVSHESADFSDDLAVGYWELIFLLSPDGLGLSEVAVSGDYADLINKPTLGTAAAADVGDFASAAEGALASSAMQPATYDSTGKAANVYNSANHDFLNSGTGPVSRSAQDRGQDTLSVLDFGTVDLTGVASAQTVVAAAIANALLSGRHVYWPAGTYVTTASIPTFHSVRHYGPGVVKRGTDLFYIEPGDAITNRIYASATGNNANDGLSSSEPVLTLGKIKGILVDTMPAQRGGTWEIKFAAGTYSDSTNFPDLPFYRNAIRFIGTGTSRTPQTIFDGTGLPYQTAGMYFLNRTNVYLQYLKFQDFASGYGVLAEKNCHIEFDDCDAENCNIGFAAGYSSFIRNTRCTATSCGTGFRAASNGQASFAPKTGLIADSNRAYSCGYGFVITRMSYGHIDYNEIEDSTNAGVLIEMNSRSAVEGNNFKRNAIAVRCWTSGYMSLNAGAPNTYNQASGTDRNTELYEFRGSSGIVNDHGQAGTMDVSLFKSTTAVTVTGTLAATQIGGNLYTAAAGWFIDNTKRVKFRAWGTATTPVDGTISLSLRLATSALSSLSIPVSVAAQPWCLEVEVIATASNAQKTFARLTCGGVAVVTELQIDAVDCLSADRAFTFFVDPNGAGGASASITVESMELTVCG